MGADTHTPDLPPGVITTGACRIQPRARHAIRFSTSVWHQGGERRSARLKGVVCAPDIHGVAGRAMNMLLRSSLRYTLLASWFVLCAAQAAGYEHGANLAATAETICRTGFHACRAKNGKTYRLSDYRGNVVVLNFWATWCPPCRYEMPSMERAHKKVRGEQIVLLAISVGDSEDQVFEFTGNTR